MMLGCESGYAAIGLCGHGWMGEPSVAPSCTIREMLYAWVEENGRPDSAKGCTR